jgi:hypothetical protein
MNRCKWNVGSIVIFVIILLVGSSACNKDRVDGQRQGMNSTAKPARNNSLPAPADDVFLIDNGYVGKVHTGMKLADVQALFGKTNVKIADSPYDPIWDLYDEAVFVYWPGEKAPLFTAGLSEYPSLQVKRGETDPGTGSTRFFPCCRAYLTTTIRDRVKLICHSSASRSRFLQL